jgi:hypothetical protein
MQELIQDRRGQDLIIEDLAPVHEALVAGHNQTSTLIASYKQSEEGWLPLARAADSQFINLKTAVKVFCRRSC